MRSSAAASSGRLYAFLAALVGVVVIAIGGGGIGPMQERWRATLARYDAEKPAVRQQASTAPNPTQVLQDAASDVRPGSHARYSD
jgi:hypothetical protein